MMIPLIRIVCGVLLLAYIENSISALASLASTMTDVVEPPPVTPPETYKVGNTRSYILNGNIAREWTGTMKNGAVFSELVISKPGGKGDVCHAVAVAKNAEERKAALEILGSITWKANGEPGGGAATQGAGE